MKLLQLQYFEAVCRLGSTSKAAIELSVSQPAISASIKELESEFSVPLFLRAGKTMQLTAEGKTFLELAKDILARSENAAQIMYDLANNRNHLRLGMSPMIASVYLPRIISAFTQRYPEVKLTVIEDGIYSLQKKLESRELDIVLNSIGPSVDSQTYRTIHVKNLNWCFCTGPDSRFADRSSITIPEINQEPLVSFWGTHHHTSRLEDHFAEFGLVPNIVYSTGQLSTAFQLIRHNNMSSFLYEPLVEQNPDLKFIPLDPPIMVKISLLWRKDSFLYSDMEKLIRCIRSIEL